MLIGYARVSTQDQNLDLQREALAKAGCQKVFLDKASGGRSTRPGLASALEMLRYVYYNKVLSDITKYDIAVEVSMLKQLPAVRHGKDCTTL